MTEAQRFAPLGFEIETGCAGSDGFKSDPILTQAHNGFDPLGRIEWMSTVFRHRPALGS